MVSGVLAFPLLPGSLSFAPGKNIPAIKWPGAVLYPDTTLFCKIFHSLIVNMTLVSASYYQQFVRLTRTNKKILVQIKGYEKDIPYQYDFRSARPAGGAGRKTGLPSL